MLTHSPAGFLSILRWCHAEYITAYSLIVPNYLLILVSGTQWNGKTLEYSLIDSIGDSTQGKPNPIHRQPYRAEQDQRSSTLAISLTWSSLA